MNLHEFFANEVKPALGCTEPGAVAFTAATAARHFEGGIEHIELKVSVSIFKNGREVDVPGAEGLRGNETAAARAKALVDAGKLALKVVENTSPVFVEVTLENPACRVTATVAHRHDTVQKIVKKRGHRVLRALPRTTPNSPPTWTNWRPWTSRPCGIWPGPSTKNWNTFFWKAWP